MAIELLEKDKQDQNKDIKDLYNLFNNKCELNVILFIKNEQQSRQVANDLNIQFINQKGFLNVRKILKDQLMVISRDYNMKVIPMQNSMS